MIGAPLRAALALAAALAALLPIAAAGQDAAEAPRRPNVLFVLADDVRFDALGCDGNPHVPTPHLDRLAQEGVLFTNATVPLALCRPSRASILTGRHSFAHGITDNAEESDALLDEVLFPELLQRAGYDTAVVGKWHVPWPWAVDLRGFDHWVSFDGQGKYHGQALSADGRRVEPDGHLTDQLTGLALDWLAARDPERPFFLLFAPKNCHYPFQPAERHRGALADVEFPQPASRDDPPATEFHRRALAALGEPEGARRMEDRARAYHELVLGLDEAVGRLVDALRERGALDDTLVLVTSDHGLLLGEHGFSQKLRTYEPALRVPLIARLPGTFDGGRVEARPASSLDLAPTVLAAAGVEVPADVQGRSLAELFGARPPEPPWPTRTLHVAGFDARDPTAVELCLRGPRYKYTALVADGFEELLFDLESDPDERHDLAGAPDQEARLARLRAELLRALDAAEGPRPAALEARAARSAEAK